MKHNQIKLLATINKSLAISLVLVFLIIFPSQAANNPTQEMSAQTGTVWSWGFNYHGQLGNGLSSYEPQPVPAKILNMSRVIDIKGGSGFGLAMDLDGNAWSWGDNTFGELGDGDYDDRYYPNLVLLPSGDHFSNIAFSGINQIAAGSHHSLAIKNDGSVWAWGFNGLGNLGNGSTQNSKFPIKVPSLSGMIAVSAGGDHSLAIKSDGSVWAWGSNSFGELGDGTSTDRSVPVQVIGLNNITAISCGSSHNLALASDGTVWAWGRNTWGQLGDGTTINRTLPVQVNNLVNISSVAAGGIHSLALMSDGTVWAWGNNYDGQLGIGEQSIQIDTDAESSQDETTRLYAGFSNNQENNDTAVHDTPQQVQGLSDVSKIAAGDYHSLALTSDGSAWSWGYNGYGELGDGTTDTRTSPVNIETITRGATIAGGSYYSMAILTEPRPIWDVNGDHVINIGDLIMIGSHWNEEGTPGWIPEDVNLDGYINVGDLIIIGEHWNETW
jgi:alpha-tubulin suppressor-like RCC1 family protein